MQDRIPFRIISFAIFATFLHHFHLGKASLLDLLPEPDNFDPCYDQHGVAKKCMADFVNVAFGKHMYASSTCGKHSATKHCMLLHHGMQTSKSCYVCNNNDMHLKHPVSYLTDLNNPNNLTCWTSENNMQYPKNVSLILNIGKKFEITYVSLQFCSMKPESMAVYKSVDHGKSWIPLQFYSGNCRKIFGRPSKLMITKANEQEALCLESGLMHSSSGSRLAFVALEGRPSAHDFDNSPVLQDWVTATDIKVTFNRLPEHFPPKGSHKDLEEWRRQSMFYSLSDFAVGGRCKCNGHASKCSVKGGLMGHGRVVCECKHNTAGNECEKCKPFFSDRPWARATESDANECIGGCLCCSCYSVRDDCRDLWSLYSSNAYSSLVQKLISSE